MPVTSRTKTNTALSAKNIWKCPDCTTDDETFPRQKFRGTPVKDWFLYQLIKENDDTGFFLKGVTHSFRYSDFFNKASEATLCPNNDHCAPIIG